MYNLLGTTKSPTACVHPIIIFPVDCSRWVRAVSCRVAADETDSLDIGSGNRSIRVGSG